MYNFDVVNDESGRYDEEMAFPDSDRSMKANLVNI